MVIKDQYDMITPNSNFPLVEYESFYISLGQIFKMSIIENQIFHEIKVKLPAYFLEISENSKHEEEMLDINLTAIGLTRVKGEREKYTRGISDSVFIVNYFGSDFDKYIDFYTNYQQFLLTYANFEGTIHSFLERKGIKSITLKNRKKRDVGERNLVDALFLAEPNLNQKYYELTGINFEKPNMIDLWHFYTIIRNLYIHKFGIIDLKFTEKVSNLKNFLEKLNDRMLIEQLILKTEDIFQLQEIKENSVFAISDANIRIFREFLIHIWESIYCIENPNFNENSVSNILNFEKNTFEFHLYSTSKQSQSMQIMPYKLTEKLKYYCPSGYLCPICNKNEFFLFKAKFQPTDLNDLFDIKIRNTPRMARNIFTCPTCKSMFFPEYLKNLSDNTGFNLLNLNDKQYTEILNKIGKIAKENLI